MGNCIGRSTDHALLEVVAPPTAPLKDETDQQHISYVRFQFPWSRRCTIPLTEHRGLNLNQLEHVISFARQQSEFWKDTHKSSGLYGKLLSIEVVNLHHLNAWVIVPATRKPERCLSRWLSSDCSMVELLFAGEQLPAWFVSHW